MCPKGIAFCADVSYVLENKTHSFCPFYLYSFFLQASLLYFLFQFNRNILIFCGLHQIKWNGHGLFLQTKPLSPAFPDVLFSASNSTWLCGTQVGFGVKVNIILRRLVGGGIAIPCWLAPSCGQVLILNQVTSSFPSP